MRTFSFLLSAITKFVAVVFVFVVPTQVWGQNQGNIVWIKQTPCSGEFDMLSVANENPNYGGGGGVFYPADQVIMGFPCTKLTDLTNSACTFAAAQSSMAAIKGSSSFTQIYANHCCRDYSVWKNQQTGAFSVVLGKNGTAGFGWSFIQGDLCCKDAESLVGIPGACSGGGGSRGGGGGGPLSGTWYGTDNGPVVLIQNGNHVTGKYQGGRGSGHERLTGTIDGTFDGKTLRCTFRNQEGKVSGSGNCHFTLTGNQLVGRWEGGGHSGDWILRK